MTTQNQTITADSLLDKIEAARNTALKAQTPESKVVKAALDSVITKLEVAQKAPKQKNAPLTDEQALDVIQATHKEYQKSIDAFQEAANEAATDSARQTCADKIASIKAEQAVLVEFLPAQMSDEDILSAVDQLIAEMGITDSKQAGRVVGAFNQKYPKKADGKVVLLVAQTVLA